MGLFSGIKNTFKKSEAAMVVQKLLETQAKVGLLLHDPAELARALVMAVWDKHPALFTGRDAEAAP
jgi:hypothetical protein